MKHLSEASGENRLAVISPEQRSIDFSIGSDFTGARLLPENRRVFQQIMKMLETSLRNLVD